MSTLNEKIEALVKFLEIEADEIEANGDNDFTAESSDYLVLTDEEADEKVVEQVKETIHYFNSNFLSDVTSLDETVFKALANTNNETEQHKAIVSIIEGMDTTWEEIAEEAVNWDGRGHFLSGYDGEEHEVNVNGTYYYIYQTN